MSRAPLFHRAYGTGLGALPAPIRTLHDIQEDRTFEGRVSVERGTTARARLTAALLRFPPAATDQRLTLRIRLDGDVEEWARGFDGRPMVSRLTAGPATGTVIERLFPVAATSRVLPDATGVTQLLVGLRILGLPVPRALWPKLDVREGAEGGRYTFRMRIEDPWGRLVVAYNGWLVPGANSPGE